MARKIKTVSKRRGYATIDLCKINTANLRRLNYTQLTAALKRLGPNPARDTVRNALQNYLFNLRLTRKAPMRGPHMKRESAKVYVQHSALSEERIQELQERAGCNLKPYEMVARDAERGGDKRTARKIRRDARKRKERG